MTSINGYQGPEPISLYGNACTDSDKLSILRVGMREYRIGLVRDHPRGDEALGNLFRKDSMKSDASQLTRAQFDSPTDLQKQLQASSSPARTR